MENRALKLTAVREAPNYVSSVYIFSHIVNPTIEW